MSRKLGGFAVVGAVGVTLAMPAAAPAMPPKPSTPAMMAITAKIRAHFNIFVLLEQAAFALSLQNPAGA